MTTLLAIDPGGARKGCSAAEFLRGELVSTWARLTAFDVAKLAPNHVVIERPQQDGRSRGVPPRILIDLAWEGALLYGAALGARACGRMLLPSDWKAAIPKAAHHSRLLAALSPAELAVLGAGVPAEVAAAARKGALSRWAPSSNGHYASASRTPDILDAVGLGLFHLGRIDKEGNPRK